MDPNVERIRQWCHALLSGNYPQTSGTLCDGKGYCCLGVACQISGLGDWLETEFDNNPLYDIPGADRHYQSAVALPKPVRHWLGVEGAQRIHVPSPPEGPHRGAGIYAGGGWALSDLNDDGLTFPQIADLIWYEYGDGGPL